MEQLRKKEIEGIDRNLVQILINFIDVNQRLVSKCQ